MVRRMEVKGGTSFPTFLLFHFLNTFINFQSYSSPIFLLRACHTPGGKPYCGNFEFKCSLACLPFYDHCNIHISTNRHSIHIIMFLVICIFCCHITCILTHSWEASDIALFCFRNCVLKLVQLSHSTWKDQMDLGMATMKLKNWLLYLEYSYG